MYESAVIIAVLNVKSKGTRAKKPTETDHAPLQLLRLLSSQLTPDTRAVSLTGLSQLLPCVGLHKVAGENRQDGEIQTPWFLSPSFAIIGLPLFRSRQSRTKVQSQGSSCLIPVRFGAASLASPLLWGILRPRMMDRSIGAKYQRRGRVVWKEKLRQIYWTGNYVLLPEPQITLIPLPIPEPLPTGKVIPEGQKGK